MPDTPNNLRNRTAGLRPAGEERGPGRQDAHGASPFPQKVPLHGCGEGLPSEALARAAPEKAFRAASPPSAFPRGSSHMKNAPKAPARAFGAFKPDKKHDGNRHHRRRRAQETQAGDASENPLHKVGGAIRPSKHSPEPLPKKTSLPRRKAKSLSGTGARPFQERAPPAKGMGRAPAAVASQVRR